MNIKKYLYSKKKMYVNAILCLKVSNISVYGFQRYLQIILESKVSVQ